MRRLFTTQEATARGLTPSQLRWGETTGRWRRVHKGVYGEGPEEPTELDRRVAEVVARGAVVGGRLAGVLHGLDSVEVDDRRSPPRRRSLPAERVVDVGGVRCADGLQTMIDLAADLDRPQVGTGARVGAAPQAGDGGRARVVTAGARPGSRPRHGADPAGAGPSLARSAADREPAGDIDGPAGPYGARPARAGAAAGGRVGQGRPGLARSRSLRRARRPAAQGPTALRRPPGDRRRGRHRLALRPVHLDRGGPLPDLDRPPARGPRGSSPPPATAAI